MRLITPIALLLVACAGAAQAQVALPDFVPGAPRFLLAEAGVNSATITPDNPGALAFGLPSRVVGGTLDGDITDNITGTPGDISGNVLGLRLVGEMFGFAAEQLTVDDDSGSGLTFEDSNEVQASVLLGEMVGLGIGIGSGSNNTTQFLSEGDRQSVGVSVRLGEMFYVGYAQVTDEVDVTQGGVTLPLERDGEMYGVAARIDGPWAWYFAYDVIDLDNFEDPSGGQAGGRELTTFSAQLLAESVLLGVTVGEVQIKDVGSNPLDSSLQIVDVGWAPAEGFTLTARMTSFDADDGSGTFDVSTEHTALMLGWQF